MVTATTPFLHQAVPSKCFSWTHPKIRLREYKTARARFLRRREPKCLKTGSLHCNRSVRPDGIRCNKTPFPARLLRCRTRAAETNTRRNWRRHTRRPNASPAGDIPSALPWRTVCRGIRTRRPLRPPRPVRARTAYVQNGFSYRLSSLLSFLTVRLRQGAFRPAFSSNSITIKNTLLRASSTLYFLHIKSPAVFHAIRRAVWAVFSPLCN